jgi:hypothetical protein
MAFRAGFVVGLRHQWRLSPWPHLIEFEKQPYFTEGKKAGAECARRLAPAVEAIFKSGDTSMMVPLVETAWRNVRK